MLNETVLVTGASGCLGHQVMKLLISHDYENVSEIRCLDLKEPEKLMKTIINEENEKVREKKGAPIKVVWVKGDIRDINTVEKIVPGVDCIIHCAAAIDLWSENEDKDVDELESINVGGTENLLRASIRFGVYKFIHVSSFEVYAGVETIYYATENTLPNPKWFLFGPSANTKKEAELKVKQYSNNKLLQQIKEGKDSLNAIIVRFPTIYGEFDKHYVSKILELTKFFGGTLRRMDNIWIRQQPIYVGNAAWSLIQAKRHMNENQSISGEEFHITDETAIGDPFDFVQPYLECKGMQVTKSSYPFLPIWILLLMLFALKRFLKNLDFFGLFTSKRSRLQEAKQRDREALENHSSTTGEKIVNARHMHWYNYITPQTLAYMCNSNFLNRTKASLRLNYEPLIGPEEAKKRSLDWYKNHLEL